MPNENPTPLNHHNSHDRNPHDSHGFALYLARSINMDVYQNQTKLLITKPVGMLLIGLSLLVGLNIFSKPIAQIDLNNYDKAKTVSTYALNPTHNQVFSLNSGTILELERIFQAQNYSLDKILKGHSLVPRLILEKLPQDFDSIKDVNTKKLFFIKSILPMILLANDQIFEMRQKIISLQTITEQGGAKATLWQGLTPLQKVWIRAIFDKYEVPYGEWQQLLRRVDGVPVSLAIAQAAIESGWGSSRFAKNGNALYGQWTWNNDENGIVPKAREDGKTHSIKAFTTPYEAVLAYINNLNIHPAYVDFRKARENLRKHQTHTSLEEPLLNGISSYSINGIKYLNLISEIIRQNNLETLDQAKLSPIFANPSPLT